MLTKREEIQPDITLITITGRMTLDRSMQEFEGFFRRLSEAGSKKVILDLSEVDYMDSSGIGTLVSCASVLTAAGGTLHVCGIHGMVENVLRTTRVITLLRCYLSVELAVLGFQEKSGAAKA